MSLHRARARRNVRLTQISALGMAGLAGLLIAMPAPPAPGASVAGGAEPTRPAGPHVSAPEATIDYTTAIDVLQNRVEHKAEIKAAPKEEPKQEEPKDEDPPQVDLPKEGPHYQYAGIIQTPKRDFALLIHHDGSSHLVPQGQRIDDEYILLGVSSERVIITDSHDEQWDMALQARPERPPLESTLSLGANPSQQRRGVTNQANPNAANGMDNEMPQIQVPGNHPNGLDPQMQERYKEIQKRREEMERNNKNGFQPPARPAPATTPAKDNSAPQARPSTPKSTAGKPDVK